MGIYETCLATVDNIAPCNDPSFKSLSLPHNTHSTLPTYIASFMDEKAVPLRTHNIYYISDIHLAHHIIHHYPNGATDVEIESHIAKIIPRMFSPALLAEHQLHFETMILFGGDISSSFDVASIFYAKFVEYCNGHLRRKPYIYAILGNHEFWNFDSLDDCLSAYSSLFNSLGIIFLNNSLTWFGSHRLPQNNKANVPYEFRLLPREESPFEYDCQMAISHNVMIVGGVGFAGHNSTFNANNRIYGNALSRTQEIVETNKWNACYAAAIEEAKKHSTPLIVLTHHPLPDWHPTGIPEAQCTYFSGHTHRNYIHHDEERNIHIFADNQIGYTQKIIKFKQVQLYPRQNPFSSYSDGVHEISIPDYISFNQYLDIDIGNYSNLFGMSVILRRIIEDNASFYMIKHDGYYGFFLTSYRGTYICIGGRIKKIRDSTNSNQMDSDFHKMVSLSLAAITPYRHTQEQISNEVKMFGGLGRIHGTIIDIDFFNHISLNPIDGSLSFYHSPLYGFVEQFTTPLELLEKHNPIFAQNFRQLPQNSLSILYPQDSADRKCKKAAPIKIDIKNSIYPLSSQINQLQHLFEKKVLRSWNEELLAIPVPVLTELPSPSLSSSQT